MICYLVFYFQFKNRDERENWEAARQMVNITMYFYIIFP